MRAVMCVLGSVCWLTCVWGCEDYRVLAPIEPGPDDWKCASHEECDDGNVCNGAEWCDSLSGKCRDGVWPVDYAICDGDELITCSEDGSMLLSETCLLGCNPAEDGARCFQLDPSNLDPGLLCESPIDLVIAGDATVDTDAGTITGIASGEVVFTPVAQPGSAPEIGVFSFNSIKVGPDAIVTVTGRRALALLGCRRVEIDGVIDASASGRYGGPGGFDGGRPGEHGLGPGAGQAGQDLTSMHGFYSTSGSGGGGHGGRGGDGGPVEHPVVEPGTGGGICHTPELIPLSGGSGGAGSAAVEVESNLPADGGGGGGAAGGGIQLEAVSVSLADWSFLAANGGGGSGGDCG